MKLYQLLIFTFCLQLLASSGPKNCEPRPSLLTKLKYLVGKVGKVGKVSKVARPKGKTETQRKPTPVRKIKTSFEEDNLRYRSPFENNDIQAPALSLKGDQPLSDHDQKAHARLENIQSELKKYQDNLNKLIKEEGNNIRGMFRYRSIEMFKDYLEFLQNPNLIPKNGVVHIAGIGDRYIELFSMVLARPDIKIVLSESKLFYTFVHKLLTDKDYFMEEWSRVKKLMFGPYENSYIKSDDELFEQIQKRVGLVEGLESKTFNNNGKNINPFGTEEVPAADLFFYQYPQYSGNHLNFDQLNLNDSGLVWVESDDFQYRTSFDLSNAHYLRIDQVTDSPIARALHISSTEDPTNGSSPPLPGEFERKNFWRRDKPYIYFMIPVDSGN